MKEKVISFLKKELELKNSLLSENNLSEDDKAVINSGILNLTSLIESLENEQNSVTEEEINTIKTAVEELNQSLTAVQEKLNQQKKEETTTMEENYLQTQNSLHDFAEIVRNSKTRKEFANKWNEILLENGISIAEGNESAFLPEAVKGRIQDIWDRNADWLKDLNIVGAKKYTIRKNDSEQDAANSRAKGWKKGDTKTSQELVFSAKEVNAQFIYKLQEISLEDEFNDDGALIDYIVKELVDQILYEIKRAVLVGDGRQAGATGKIDKIEAIAKSTTDIYTTVSTVTANGFLVDDMRAMVDNIKNDNSKPVYVFMSKADLRTLARVQASSTSTPVYLTTEQVAEQIGATKIITTDLLGATYKAVAMIPSEYVMIGEGILNPVLYTWHEGYTNTNVYRYETVIGGAIEGLKSTAVLKA